MITCVDRFELFNACALCVRLPDTVNDSTERYVIYTSFVVLPQCSKAETN